MEDMSRQLDVRARVVAIYQKYCPEKSLSHVDFLLAKYRGFEEELMEVLVEKYGPEPATSGVSQNYEREVSAALGPSHTPQSVQALLSRYHGMEESLLHNIKASSPLRPSNSDQVAEQLAKQEQSLLVRESDEDRNDVFRRHQDQFRKDMLALNKEKQHRAARTLQENIHSSQEMVQSQEKEIRTLRSDLLATRARHEETMSKLEDEVRRVATELTKTKMELLRLESLATPGAAPLSQLTAVEAETSKVSKETLDTLQLLYVYERVVRTHLALYPITPLRTRLREVDLPLSVRLDTL